MSLLFARFREMLLSAGGGVVWRVQVPLVIATGVLLQLSFMVQRFAWESVQAQGQRLSLSAWDATAWVVWPLAAPVMWLMIQRFPLAKGVVRRNALRLALASAALLVIIGNLRFGLRMLQVWWSSADPFGAIAWADYLTTELVLLPFDFLIYCGFFSATLAIDKHFKHRQRVEESIRLELRTAQLESELAQAELHALRGQLHPHFLFNSFNAVVTLIRQRRNDEAVDVITELGMLMRMTMERTGRQEVPLAEEVEFVRRYLHLEWIRFGEKLLPDYEIDPTVLRASVPSFLLQPLVENAIKHGISKRRNPGRVRVSAERRAGRLIIEIENDGPESKGAVVDGEVAQRRDGIGLANTRARLARIYGTDHRIELRSRSDGGMIVQLDLPWREAVASVST
mgnify:CR=1 FL=1|jgi:Putative regulator of cell autolysis